MLSFIAVAMAITALLTILQWQSLFPSARDCLALVGLPIQGTGKAVVGANLGYTGLPTPEPGDTPLCAV